MSTVLPSAAGGIRTGASATGRYSVSAASGKRASLPLNNWKALARELLVVGALIKKLSVMRGFVSFVLRVFGMLI